MAGAGGLSNLERLCTPTCDLRPRWPRFAGKLPRPFAAAILQSMRRQSDSSGRDRTGRGRRSRDRLLTGTAPSSCETTELDNLYLFVGDDIRESALSLSSIEQYLVEVQAMLADPAVKRAALDPLLNDTLANRLDDLDSSLSSLVRRLDRLRATLPPAPGDDANAVLD